MRFFAGHIFVKKINAVNLMLKKSYFSCYSRTVLLRMFGLSFNQLKITAHEKTVTTACSPDVVDIIGICSIPDDYRAG
jgi:hypothetical protein